MSPRALVTRGDKSVGLEDRAPLVARAGELVVAPRTVGLCGTDLELIDGAIDPAYVRYPLVIGHEWTGVVISSQSSAFTPGDWVVVEGIVPCHHCVHCAAGATNICDTYAELGFTFDGAAADEVRVRAELAHRIAPHVASDDAALVEPASVVYHGLSRIVARPGLECLVVGDGTIGLFAAQLLTLWSPARLVLAGMRPEQADLARAMGADEFLRSAPKAEFDLVVEAAGTPASVADALGAARRGGSVLLLGLPPHGIPTPVPVDDLVNGDLLIRASFAYTSTSWSRVVALINAGRIHPGIVVTHRFGLEAYESAVSALRTPASGSARGKVVLELPGDAPRG